MYWPEKEIFEGIKRGDRDLFDSVFKNYYFGLRVFAFDFVKSLDVADEIVQEVFLNLWEKHNNLQIKSSLKAYLYKCVQNYCLNYLRSDKGFKNVVQLDLIPEQSDFLLVEMSFDELDASFSEQIEIELDRAIKSLPEQCQQIFLLSRFENYSYPEIAERLGVSVSTVKTQMSRAMQKLRAIMDNYL